LAAYLTSVGYAQKSVEDILRQSQQARTAAVEAMSQGIVRVEAYRGEDRNNPELGTGIVLSASPEKIWILTALHVIQQAHVVDITFYSSRPMHYQATILPRRSEALDLALLQVIPQGNPKLPTIFPEYHFLQNGELQLAEQVYTVNGQWSLVPNTISHLSHEGDVQRFEYTDVSVGVGFSGGPVFDQLGNIIGMHDALTGDEPRFAVAIKIDSALQTLQALDYAVPKAVPFSMPQVKAAGIPQANSTGGATGPGSASSDLELYQKALLSSDPAAMEEAAARLSNPALASSLRMQAATLRSISAGGSSKPGSAPDSRRRLQMQTMKMEADGFERRGNYMKAFPLYQQLADGGDSESMASLGYFYYNGWGVEKDYLQAAKWFEKAATAGETSVMATLGLMYAMGEGVQRNDAVAVEWNRKAAAAGNSTGMLGLGFMYKNGRGVPKNLKTAAEWYRKSADLGNETAKANLRRLGLPQ